MTSFLNGCNVATAATEQQRAFPSAVAALANVRFVPAQRILNV